MKKINYKEKFMAKKKTLLAVLLLAVLAFGCALFAACGGGGTKFQMTWTVDENVTVAVEGYDKLPEKVKEGEVINFTVTPDNGYEIASVSGARKSGSKYTVTVNKDTEIKITARKILVELTVEGFDNTKQYISGDVVDVTGVVVTATYFDGDVVVPLKEGTADGYTVSALVGGDTSVTFSYGKKDVEISIPTVRYKVTLDLGKDTVLDSALLTVYESQANYSKDSKTGVMTFSYLNLAEGTEIRMPTADDMTRTNRNFLDWQTENGVKLPEKLTSKSAEDVVFKANWELQIANITKVELKVETVTVEDTENEGTEAQAKATKEVPYLIIEGTFTGAVSSARLQLKEGNKNISMYGPEIKPEEGSNAFVLKFDLTELLNQKDEDGNLIDFEGAWCDIRLNATVDKEEESQQIHITEGQTIVDLEQMIKVDKRAYVFATHAPEGSTDKTLKVYYNFMMIEYTPSFAVKTVGEGENAQKVPTLTLTGNVNKEEYFGKTLSIDAWRQTGSIPAVTTAIGANGAFSIDIDMSTCGKGSDAFFHLKILNGTTPLYPTSGEADIPISASTIKIPATPDAPLPNSIRYSDDNNIAYYIGNKWGGLMAYVRDESAAKLTVTNATFEKGTVNFGTTEAPQEKEVAMLVLSGTWSAYDGVTLTAEQVAQKFLKNSQHSLQTGYHFNGANSWDYLDGAREDEEPGKQAKHTIIDVQQDGTFTVKLIIDGAVATHAYYVHFGAGNLGAANVKFDKDAEITVEGLTYSFVDTSSMDTLNQAGMTDAGQTWYVGLLMITAAKETPDPAPEVPAE